MTEENHFKNHKATLSDYGKIKILTFANPDDNYYFIRFTFDEELYKLYISGDLGELVATNYKNMCYKEFGDFVDDPGYFISKVDCCSRGFYEYDEGKAETELKQLIEEHDISDKILESYDSIEDFIEDVLEYFSYDNGISSEGYSVASEYIMDFWEVASYIGRKSSGIAELYLTAFKLAKQQLNKEE